MKKKSSFFFLIFIFGLISFTKVYSKQVCDLLLDDYKKNYTEYNLDTIPYSEINDFGFDLQKKFNINLINMQLSIINLLLRSHLNKMLYESSFSLTHI